MTQKSWRSSRTRAPETIGASGCSLNQRVEADLVFGQRAITFVLSFARRLATRVLLLSGLCRGRPLSVRVLDQVGHGLTGPRSQRGQGPQLGTGHPRVTHQRQQFDLIQQQPGLLIVVAVEEEGRGDAERAGQRRDEPRIWGLAAWPLRSFQIVVCENSSPVTFSMRALTSALRVRPPSGALLGIPVSGSAPSVPLPAPPAVGARLLPLAAPLSLALDRGLR